MAAQLQDRDVLIRLKSSRRQRIACESIRFRAVLRDTDSRAFEIFQTVKFRIAADHELLAGQIGRGAEDRDFGAARAGANQRRGTGEYHIDIARDERLDQSRAAGNKQDFSGQIILGENSTFFGHPWKRQRNARAYVGDTQLISGYGTAARKNETGYSDRP